MNSLIDINHLLKDIAIRHACKNISKYMSDFIFISKLHSENVFSDAELISLRNRGDVVSPLVLKYKP